MTEKEFQKLINQDKYQVFIFYSWCTLPILGARHPWIVINEKGKVSRWEVVHIKNLTKDGLGYLSKDLLLPWQGVKVFLFSKKPRWDSKMLGLIEGEENSTAHHMANFVNNSKINYPNCHRYNLLGPNSNTYAQWIISNFPEFKVKLPWNCFGKNYKLK
jgi:hypothetical protein